MPATPNILLLDRSYQSCRQNITLAQIGDININQEYLHYSAEFEERSFKCLRAINAQHIIHDEEELPHSLGVLRVDLLHQRVQINASSPAYLCGPCQQPEMTGGLNQL